MKTLKNILSFFLSLRTAVWLLTAIICFLLYGSFVMQRSQEFQLLNFQPLLRWMWDTPGGITWWLWVSIALLALLTANTIVCSIESIIRKRHAREWVLVLSPQVIHLGFLLILLGHLMSSVAGFKGTAYVSRGSVLGLPNGLTAVFNSINVTGDEYGYISNWSAGVDYLENGRRIASDIIAPNSPSLRNGLGIYIKTVEVNPYPVALIEVSREPGALWALAGGILFLVGTMTLLVLKVRREE